MTMIFCDSFDHYTSDADILRKWDYYLAASQVSIQASGGRRGGGCLRVSNTSNTYAVVKQVPAASTYIVGTAIKFANLTGTEYVIGFREGTVDHVTIRPNPDGSLRVYRGSTQILSSAGGLIGTGNWYYLEILATISDTVGVVTVKLDGTTIITATGSPAALDTRNGGTSGVIDNIAVGSASANDTDFDDLVILNTSGSRNNSFLGDVRIDCYRPNGNGASSQFDGSDGNSTDNYLLVDDTAPDDDTTYVESATVNDVDSYTFGNMSHTPATIKAVQLVALCTKADAGSRSMKLVTRRSGTDYLSSEMAAPASYRFVRDIRETDPAAASPNDWTKTNVDAAEFGIKVSA
ncbi:MAG TPA: hypothetical protein PKC95_00035 [Thauera aminoaromatica]|nr:hypothetical protein [Thauera aminoaromatica]